MRRKVPGAEHGLIRTYMNGLGGDASHTRGELTVGFLAKTNAYPLDETRRDETS